MTLVVSGDRDPGYGATSPMIGEVAVCLARDLPKTALSGGFWTPGAAIADKIVTYDFARLMDDATEVKTSEFGAAVIARM